MNLLLNIGLARQGQSNIGVGTVLRELAAEDLTVRDYRIHTSDTEQTVVAEVEPGIAGALNFRLRINHLSRLLGQDCIAVYVPERGVGELIGPRAAEWGEFDPRYFLTVDGYRLG